MIYLYLRHTLTDYARWKEAFDMHLAARQAGGATHQVMALRSEDNPQEIVALLGWRDLTTARLFIQSVSWQVVLERMGVVDVPEVRFLEADG